MKFCNECNNYSSDSICSIKGYKVSINANFCNNYKLSSETRRKEVADFLNTQGYEIDFSDGLWMEEYCFQEHKMKEIIDLMLDWGDKCLKEAKS